LSTQEDRKHSEPEQYRRIFFFTGDKKPVNRRRKATTTNEAKEGTNNLGTSRSHKLTFEGKNTFLTLPLSSSVKRYVVIVSCMAFWDGIVEAED